MKLKKVEIAEVLQVSTRTISSWQRAADFPEPERQGRTLLFDAAATVAWWHARQIERLVKTSDGYLDPIQEKAALDRARRLQVEMATKARRRELIERRPAERTMAITAGRIRDGLIVIADRLGPVVAAETDPDRVRQLMIDEIEQTLTVLADAGKDMSEQDEAEALEDLENERKDE